MSRVLIYTDQPLLGAGFLSVLRESGDLAPAGVCGSIEDLGAFLHAQAPDVILLDVGPSANLSLVHELRTRAPGCKLVLWCASATPEFVLLAIEAGTHGLLPNHMRPNALVDALRAVSAGEVRFDLKMAASGAPLRRVHLTRRERQLMGLLCQGLQNKEIASVLGLREGSIKVYLSRLFDKTGARDRFELALLGLKSWGELSADWNPQRGPETLLFLAQRPPVRQPALQTYGVA